jgi:NAD(P)-dependent dehydrogenase (short-subunit alcohol dehydrogenase family)
MNKVAIVTGAGQGVGRGIALALAKEGAAITLYGRTPATLKKVAAEIEGFGGQRAGAQGRCEISRQISRPALTATLAAFGGIDILINNAQEVPLGPLLMVSDEAFMDGFMSGPLASFRFMKACHPHFVARGGGAVINLGTSAAVRWDMANYGAYAAVKQATRALTRAACAEWGKRQYPGEHGGAARDVAGDGNVDRVPPGGGGGIRQNHSQWAGSATASRISAARWCSWWGLTRGILSGATIPLDGGQANFD